MVFSSVIFLFLFLPFVLTIYFFLGRKLRNLFLLSANLIFYAFGEVEYVLILIIYIIGNYFFGIMLEKWKPGNTSDEKRKSFGLAILGISIAFNLGFLVYYKYANFITDNFNLLLALLGIGQLKLSPVHLPIGISFFTFQAISYVIDIYRNDVKATRNFIDFALYKSLFPQLIAGPIVRYRDVAQQITSRIVSIDGFNIGIKRFIIGLGKKVLIANTVASVADQIFALPANQLTLELTWLGILCYTLQIYFDFSGYSDMAIGLGQMFGFKFLENFNYPYISQSIQEFWRRWHISLSTWFRDYLYIPLGGSRCSQWRTYGNLITVFLLCGLWHGASWTFAIWGLWHGFFLVMERVRFGGFIKAFNAPLKHAYALLVIMVGWVFFRSETVPYAVAYIKAMGNLSDATGPSMSFAMDYLNSKVVLAIAFGTIASTPLAPALSSFTDRYLGQLEGLGNVIIKHSYSLAHFAFYATIFMASSSSLASGTYNPFIYFRF